MNIPNTLKIIVIFFIVNGITAPAFCIGPSPGMSIKAINRGIQTNIRQAVKPTFDIRSRYAAPVTAIAVNKSGSMLASISKNGSTQIWNLQTGQREKNLETNSGKILSLAFIPGTRLLSTGSEKGIITLWDIKTGKDVGSFKGHSKSISGMAATSNGKFLVFAGGNIISVWDIEKKSVVRELTGHQDTVLSFALKENIAVAGSKDEKIIVWDIHNGAILNELKGDGTAAALAFSPDKKILAAGFKKGSVSVWNLDSGQKILSFTAHKKGVKSVSIDSNSKYICSSGSDNTAVLWNLADGKAVQRYEGHTDAVNAALFIQNNRYLITASDDKTIRLWSVSSGKELTRMISMRYGWGAVSPEGYFDGALDGNVEERLDALCWKAENRSLALDGFLEGYYRPALIGRMLAGKPLIDKKIPNISEGFYLPPTVLISDPEPDSVIRKDTISVKVQATDEGGGIKEIRLYHNGKIIGDQKAERKVDKSKGETKIYSVPLVDGKNIFRAVGLSNNSIEGEFYEISVNCKIETPPPILHVFVVGLNKYKNPDFNLNFCEPDAREVLGYFSISHSKVFSNLAKYELYNDQATQKSIQSALDNLEKIPPQDTVVIYLAGHGETTLEDDNWYFIPYDVTSVEKDEYLKEKGISSSMLQLLIAKIGARHILLMLDACKSGGIMDVFGEYNDQRHFAILSRAAGIHIAAAAKKEQYAGELVDLGHGVFTYTLIEGLKGKADNSPLDGNISVQEILKYISQRMPEIIEQHAIPSQNPVLNSRGMDFTVGAFSETQK